MASAMFLHFITKKRHKEKHIAKCEYAINIKHPANDQA